MELTPVTKRMGLLQKIKQKIYLRKIRKLVRKNRQTRKEITRLRYSITGVNPGFHNRNIIGNMYNEAIKENKMEPDEE